MHSSTIAPQIPQDNNYADAWSEAEIKALVHFVHFHCDNSNWPTATSFVRTKLKQHFSDQVK